jgi:anti-anti-sigma regulatory factor
MGPAVSPPAPHPVMSTPAPPPVRLAADGDLATLHLTGAVGLSCAEALAEAACEARDLGLPVCVDGSALQHLDAAGYQVLLALGRDLSRRHLTLVLAHWSADCQRYLTLAGFDGPLAAFSRPS